VNFPVDPNETKKNTNHQIQLFGSPEEPNIWLFGYLVIWLFGYSAIQLFGYSVIQLFGYLVIRLFGCLGQPNTRITKLFGYFFGYSGHQNSPECTQI
jgi:hypothetical protein